MRLIAAVPEQLAHNDRLFGESTRSTETKQRNQSTHPIMLLRLCCLSFMFHGCLRQLRPHPRLRQVRHSCGPSEKEDGSFSIAWVWMLEAMF